MAFNNTTISIEPNSSMTNAARESISSVNYFLISTEKCTSNYSNSYCYYSSFVVLCGYLCNMAAIAFVLYRLVQLKTKFRNQYNLTLLWLCSILLVALIDIVEFISTGNGKVYSSAIVLIQCFLIVLCIWAIVQYARRHSIGEPAYFRAIIVAGFSACLFILIVIARVWSQKSLARFADIGKLFPARFHIINTYFFLYFFVYAMFASVQVYENVMSNFARCLTNLSYALWFLGSFMLGFYSDLLPKKPAYDYIHYRNYFLITTLIVIILQDLYFIRLRGQNAHNITQVKTISMKNFNPVREHRPSILKMGSKYQGLNYVDTVFDPVTAHKNVTDDDDEEETYFDVEQFSTKGKQRIEEANAVNENELVLNRTKSKCEIFTERYKNYLLAILVLFLVLNLLYSTVALFRSVTFSHFTLLTPLIHPFAIIFAVVFKNYGYKCVSN